MNATAVKIDVIAEAEYPALFRQSPNTCGRLPYAFNYAGTSVLLPIIDDPTADFWRVSGLWIPMC